MVKSNRKIPAAPSVSAAGRIAAGTPAVPSPAASENRRWLESLEFVMEHLLKHQESELAPIFVHHLIERLRQSGIAVPEIISTPYLNSIPTSAQPPYPARA